MIIDLILFSAFISFVLSLWFQKTEVFLFIFTMIGGDWIWDKFKIFEYYQFKKEYFDIDYPDYLSEQYPNILTKLLNCPFCLAFWLSLGIFGWTYGILFSIAVMILSLVWYNLIFSE